MNEWEYEILSVSNKKSRKQSSKIYIYEQSGAKISKIFKIYIIIRTITYEEPPKLKATSLENHILPCIRYKENRTTIIFGTVNLHTPVQLLKILRTKISGFTYPPEPKIEKKSSIPRHGDYRRNKPHSLQNNKLFRGIFHDGKCHLMTGEHHVTQIYYCHR
mgnify:CR=1 FL=1